MRRTPGVGAVPGLVTPWLIAGSVLVAGPSRAAGSDRRPPDPARSVTVPFALDHNRMIVDVEFVRRDGTIRAAHAWVDTGNPVLFLAETLARDLGLNLPGAGTGGGPDAGTVPAPAPPMRLGGVSLATDGVTTRIRPGPRVMPGVPAEANLPASALRHGRVVFDYPARRLTYATAGARRPRGVAVPCRVNAATGLVQVAATIAGETVELAIDNGSAGTWVSRRLTAAWRSRHPEWPRATGAVGSANFFGFPFEVGGDLVRIPMLEVGAVRLAGVGVLGVDQDVFDWYSGKTVVPVAGFIGANALQGVRLEVDFARGMTYWDERSALPAGDFDTVGLTLRPEVGGGYTVAGVAAKDGRAAVAGVEPGDALVSVDGFEVAHATMGRVVAALRGKPGATRTLVVERAGARATVVATVVSLP
ncbi:MAG: PDZ domain-containing protein [Thermoanaerobaculaceae bacterium]|nr:PDZ domain-containing protein [Thermoanaerobaculaceae bacterium]